MKGRKSSDFLKRWLDLKGDPIFFLSFSTEETAGLL